MNFCWRLDLSYKGERDYLHGSDIIPELLKKVGKVESVVFQFHRIIKHPIKAFYVDEQNLNSFRRENKVCAIVSFLSIKSAKRKIIALMEDEDMEVTSRQNYDENEVVSSSIFIGQIITQRCGHKFSFFERIVALNKKLLNEITGKSEWLFVRLDLERYPLDPDSINIEFISEIGGSIFKSNVSSNGTILGSIFFSPRVL